MWTNEDNEKLKPPSKIQTKRDQELPQNVEYLSYWGSRLTNGVRSARDTKSRSAMGNSTEHKKEIRFTSKLDLKKVEGNQ